MSRWGYYLAVGLALFAGQIVAAPIVTFSVTDLGPGSPGLEMYRLSFTNEDFSLLVNQELDIRFDPGFYESLSNPNAPISLAVLLNQPDAPPGAFGDYSLTALANTVAPFSFTVDVLAPVRPVSQPFFINQLDPQGMIIETLATGTTVESAVPEPSPLHVVSLALLLGVAYGVLRRNAR
jgi:hypothetical protein